MATKARQADVEAASLWVTIAESAVSAHRSVDGSRRYGTSIGAMRMSAPLPADRVPHWYHGR